MRTFAQRSKAIHQTLMSKSTKASTTLAKHHRDVRAILQMQRITGSQAVQSLLRADSQSHEVESSATAAARFVHDFSQIPIHPAPPQRKTQPKLTVSTSGDMYELQADRVADQVMHMSEPNLQRACPCGGGRPKSQNRQDVQTQIQTKPAQGNDIGKPASSAEKAISSPGHPLNSTTRDFFEPRMGYDLTKVRVHTDSSADKKSRALNARAFTQGRNIYFRAGRYDTQSNDGKRLLAHELTHFIQQNGGEQSTPNIQRRVELRPPGPGEASGFGRVQELIDRLNNLPPQPRPITYRLDGQNLAYDLHDEASLTHFDRQMRAFIDRGVTVPMRLITSQGLSTRPGNPPGTPLEPVDVDDFDMGYVDIEDLLACDDLSLQLNFVHILEERFQTRNYARRIGTVISDAIFNRAHRAGLNAEATLLQNLFNDPTIRFTGQYNVGSRTLFQFTSQAEGYRIFHEFRFGRRVAGGTVFVIARPGGRRQTVSAFLAQRNAQGGGGPAAP